MSDITITVFGPNSNVSEKTTLFYIQAIKFFGRNGVNQSAKFGVSSSQGFERMTYPVQKSAEYEHKYEFDLNAIGVPCLKANGQERSPALSTYCRRMGLLDVVAEKNGAFSLTALASAVDNQLISVEEYALILLGKLGVFSKGKYCSKLLYLFAMFVSSNNWQYSSKEFISYIEQYIGSGKCEERFDLIENAFRFAGLLYRIDVNDGKKNLVVPSNVYDIVDVIKKYGDKVTETPVETFASDVYIGDLNKGLLELVSAYKTPFKSRYPGIYCIVDSALHGYLHVGDRFVGKDDGPFVVVENLPKVYRIKAEETGKIRSVPKSVVSAWYSFYQIHNTLDFDIKKKDGTIGHKSNVPIREVPTRIVREIINATTIDDKYEHGYDGMLGTIARWLLDHPERRDRIDDSVPPSPQPDPLTNIDRLTISLKLFEEVRAKEHKYDQYAANERGFFSDIDGEKLKNTDWGSFCSHRFNSSQASAHFRGYSETEKKALGEWLKAVREEPQDISRELARMPDLTGLGTGGSISCMFMMKTNPTLFCSYAKQGYMSLVFLGLEEGQSLPPFTLENYYRVKQSQTQIINAMIRLGIHREDGKQADFITVNKFLWFVDDNQDLIKEKVMSKKFKTDKPTPYNRGRKELSFSPEVKDDELLLRLLSSLRAKPFAILAGHSGTGKSRYVKKLAYMTCNAEELRTDGKLPGNFLLLQVKPNWHDSTELLGIRNAMDENHYQRTALIEFLFKAYHFKDTPFFLCLDEMNLAPVEQYFAEFLSSMESEEPVPLNDIKADEDNLFELGCEWVDAQEYVKANGFSIPNNMFIVGTVNMDETTNQFSRKVLDRAFTIEMTDVDFTKFGAVTKPSYEDTISEATIEALLKREKSVTKLDEDDVIEESSLVKVQKALEPTAFAVAYRFASEYTLLKRAITLFDPKNIMKLDALDQAVLMKVLPRIAGEADYIRKFVYGKSVNEGLRKALEGKKMSLDKIAAILKRAEETDAQYITFWP